MLDELELLLAKPITHRGYHNASNQNFENSFSAFQAAIDAGFGIECDLQVTADRKVMVFHDPDLDRMTSETGPVRHRKSADLSKLELLDSKDKIHSLDEHLELVNGRVPLLIEFKGIAGEDNGMVDAAAKSLKSYKGPVAIMSFNHWIVRQFSELIPERPRGLTAMGGDNFQTFHTNAMKEHDLHFVSYRVHDLPCKFITSMKEDYDKSVITWTVRTEEESDLSYANADQITFEGYDPSKPVT